jgi:hypothetical protein
VAAEVVPLPFYKRPAEAPAPPAATTPAPTPVATA